MTKPQKRTGRPSSKAIRWTPHFAERETGIDRATITRRARALEIDPGPDGCYSTKQLISMIAGDKEAEVIGKLAAERRGQELKNALTVGELIPTHVAARVAEIFLVPVRQRILSSSLSDDEKSDMLADLVSFGEVDWTAEAIGANRR